MKLIQVKYLKPSSKEIARVRAFVAGDLVIMRRDYNTELQLDIIRAAQALMDKLQWRSKAVLLGTLPNGDYVCGIGE